MDFKSVPTLKHLTQFSNLRSNSLSFPISMPSVVFFIYLREKSEPFESYSSTSDHFTRYAVTLTLENNFQKSGTNYRCLQLPVHPRNKNMFCWPIKSFDNQTSKFTCPLGNVLAPLTQTFKGKQSQSLLLSNSYGNFVFCSFEIYNEHQEIIRGISVGYRL